jgi:hypothetical protein
VKCTCGSDIVTIICPKHGEFKQKAYWHLNGSGCSKCYHERSSTLRKTTLNEFKEKARQVHGNKYDYSKVNYINSTTKVCIICPEHGEFWQAPSSHLSGQGCPKCARIRTESAIRSSTEEFIKKANEKYGDRYDYSKVDYKGSEIPVCITCPEHGEFWITPHHFLQGHGCQKCAKWVRYDRESFIERSKQVHGDKYNYDKLIYNGITKPITLICPIHGEFTQNAHSHLNGHDCPECSGKKRYTFEHFLKKAREVHGDKYQYREIEKVENLKSKVAIICPEHGEFVMSVDYHINGKHGCPKCNESKLEAEVRTVLERNHIKFDREVGASSTYGFDWLITSKKNNNSQELDFYLPEYKLVIEAHGLQHFKPIDYFGGEEGFKKGRVRDERKYNECAKRGIKVIYYTNYKDVEYPHPLIHTKSELLKEIKKRKKEILLD